MDQYFVFLILRVCNSRVLHYIQNYSRCDRNFSRNETPVRRYKFLFLAIFPSRFDDYSSVIQRSHRSVSPSYNKLNPISSEHLAVNRTHRNLSVVCIILYALPKDPCLSAGRLINCLKDIAKVGGAGPRHLVEEDMSHDIDSSSIARSSSGLWPSPPVGKAAPCSNVGVRVSLTFCEAR
jgi:hypothetical protein